MCESYLNISWNRTLALYLSLPFFPTYCQHASVIVSALPLLSYLLGFVLRLFCNDISDWGPST
jgi:hypothetical protein